MNDRKAAPNGVFPASVDSSSDTEPPEQSHLFFIICLFFFFPLHAREPPPSFPLFLSLAPVSHTSVVAPNIFADVSSRVAARSSTFSQVPPAPPYVGSRPPLRPGAGQEAGWALRHLLSDSIKTNPRGLFPPEPYPAITAPVKPHTPFTFRAGDCRAAGCLWESVWGGWNAPLCWMKMFLGLFFFTPHFH